MPKEIKKYQTAQTAQWKNGKCNYKAIVTYGMHYLYGNISPHFFITTEVYCKNPKGRWFLESCGCLHNRIREKAPHLNPLISFHLTDQNGLPMYYLENGYYWYKENLDTFKSYVRLSDDELIPEVPKVKVPVLLNDNGTEIDLPQKEQEKIIEKARKKFITDWLKTREGKLKQEFEEAMKQFSVEFITQAEIDTLR